MLTGAPPELQPTWFNIHDITSSLGGPGMEAQAAGCSRWKERRDVTGPAVLRVCPILIGRERSLLRTGGLLL